MSVEDNDNIISRRRSARLQNKGEEGTNWQQMPVIKESQIELNETDNDAVKRKDLLIKASILTGVGVLALVVFFDGIRDLRGNWQVALLATVGGCWAGGIVYSMNKKD